MLSQEPVRCPSRKSDLHLPEQCLKIGYLIYYVESDLPRLGNGRLQQQESLRASFQAGGLTPMNTGSTARAMPTRSKTRVCIKSFNSMTSRAVPRPRLTIASACFVDVPTLPCVYPR